MAATQLLLTAVMAAFLVGEVATVTRLENWRTYAPSVGRGGAVGESAHGHREKPHGLTRCLTTVDHKGIGILYGTFAVLAFAWDGVAVVLTCFELFRPATEFLNPSMYNALLTSHGITMLFLFGTPILAAFSNYFVPILIGADDVTFPRINAIAFWLLPFGAALIWAGFFSPGIAPAQTSWTISIRSSRTSTTSSWAASSSPASTTGSRSTPVGGTASSTCSHGASCSPTSSETAYGNDESVSDSTVATRPRKPPTAHTGR